MLISATASELMFWGAKVRPEVKVWAAANAAVLEFFAVVSSSTATLLPPLLR